MVRSTSLPTPLSTAVRQILILSSGAASGVGMARFGFGPLLPAMRSDLGWSLSDAGFIQASNLAAYLIGSLAAPRIIKAFGLQRPFALSYIAVALALIGTGLATSIPSHLILRLIAGLGAAVLWISGGTIAARLASDQSSGLIIGLFFGGLGVGVVATGLLIPLAFDSQEGWRGVWLLMGSAAGVMTPLVIRALRATSGPISISVSGETRMLHSPNPLVASRSLLRLEISYFLFGLGSIGYMTFVIALLRHDQAGTKSIALFWIGLGSAIVIAGRLWANLISTSRSGHLLALFYLVMAAAGLVPVLSTTIAALVISGVAFGMVFVSAVTATTHLIRVHLPSELWTSVLARFTVGFGLALTLGASGTGMIADQFSINTGIVVSILTITAAALVASRQPAPQHQ